MRSRYIFIAFALLAASPAYADADGDAFAARVAACKTDKCRLEAASAYFFLSSALKEASWLQEKGIVVPDEAKETGGQLRCQLHEPELLAMIEDGRWKAMSYYHQVVWVETHCQKYKDSYPDLPK